MAAWYRHCALTLLLALSAAAPACRRHEPPTLVAKNLGTADRPLPPTPMVRYDLTGLKGKAIPQRAGDVDDEPAEHDRPDSGTDGISQDDRDLIEEAVVLTLEALANEQYDEALEFLVPDQRESAGRLLEQVAVLVEAQKALEAAIAEKAPGASENIILSLSPGLAGAIFGARGISKDSEELIDLIEVGQITLTEEDQAVARIGIKGAGSQTVPVSLRLIDDEWFVGLPRLLDDAELVDALIDLLKVIDRKVRDLSGRIEDGSVGPEMLQAAIMQMTPEIVGAAMSLLPKIQALTASFNADQGEDAPVATDQDSNEANEADEDAESDESDDQADPSDTAQDDNSDSSERRGRGRGRGRAEGIG